jgi:hypothetical protein
MCIFSHEYFHLRYDEEVLVKAGPYDPLDSWGMGG